MQAAEKWKSHAEVTDLVDRRMNAVSLDFRSKTKRNGIRSSSF
jgi:hypothetical protein